MFKALIKAYRKNKRYSALLRKINLYLPFYDPDTGRKMEWEMRFNFHTRYNPKTGEPLQQKSLPSVRIEGRFKQGFYHPMHFVWASKEVKVNKRFKIIPLG